MNFSDEFWKVVEYSSGMYVRNITLCIFGIVNFGASGHLVMYRAYSSKLVVYCNSRIQHFVVDTDFDSSEIVAESVHD